MSTFTPIQSFTLGANSAEILLTNLPQNYVDLVVQCTFGASVGMDIGIRFNNNSNSIYSTQRLAANSTNVGASRDSGNILITPRTPANQATTITTAWSINVGNYSSTSTNKTTTQRYGHSDAFTEVSTGLFRSTVPITNMTLVATGGATFQSGTTVNIYGIEGGTPKAQGGSIVTTDGTYYYHTFTGSGRFIPNEAITADILVVAGGGGGGGQIDSGNTSGGGGAGGYQTFTSQSLTAQSYTITVGAGGAGGTVGANDGAQGSNSVFGTLTASVGGGFGQRGFSGSFGGSGGSGGGNSGSGTSGQGNAGGAAGADFQGGGGGGASAAGSTNGNGGAGTANSYSGSSVTYAGGGGGGQYFNSTGSRLGGAGGGGNGGGWNGSILVAPVAGTRNLGGGGGGAGSRDGYGAQAGAAGGSGVVIIRYAV